MIPRMNPRPFAALFLMVLLIAGCATTEVSNLTPRTLPATPARTYPFEVTWDSSRRGVKTDDVHAWVMVDQTLYPMTRVASTVNRWAAEVPIPDGKSYVPYKYKFEYTYPGIDSHVVKSEWSSEYRLVIPQQ